MRAAEAPGALLWRPTTTNRKTGNIPTAIVHPDRIEESCEGCPQAPEAGGGCYARTGTVSFSLKATARAAARRPQAYTVGHALSGRLVSARYARVTSIGDAGGLPQEEVEPQLEAVRAAGLHPIAYTSRWKKAPWLQRWAMASTYSARGYRSAVARGWRATLVVPAGVVADHVEHGTPLPELGAVLCPSQVGELTGEATTCNECGLCSVSKNPDGPGVLFAEHGPRVSRAWKRRVEAARERLLAALVGER